MPDIEMMPVDAEEAGIERIVADVHRVGMNIYVALLMYPDDEVQDASGEDFPQFEAIFSAEEFKRYLDMLNQFWQSL